MQKQIIAYILLFIILSLGLLLLYRSFSTISDWTIIKGKIIDQKIEYCSSSKGVPKYALVFTVNQTQNRIGIFLGSQTNAHLKSESILKLIDPVREYTFYLDPTVIVTNGIQLGIRQIQDGDKIIFKESNTFNNWCGSFFILLGVFGILIVYKFEQKNKN